VHGADRGRRQWSPGLAAAFEQRAVQIVDDPFVDGVQLPGSDVGGDIAANQVSVVHHRGRLDVDLPLGQPAIEFLGQGAVSAQVGVTKRGPGVGLAGERGGLRSEALAFHLPAPTIGSGRQIDDVHPPPLAVGERV